MRERKSKGRQKSVKENCKGMIVLWQKGKKEGREMEVGGLVERERGREGVREGERGAC